MVIRKQLESAIKGSGESVYSLAKSAGVPQSTISRFLQGADMRISVAEKLAAHFGLELRPADKPAKGKRK